MVDVLDGIENTISGPATTFQINPSVAARAGFTPEEIATDAAAILEGEPAAAPVISNDRPYTVRVRFPAENRASLEAMRDTLLTSSTGKTATLGALATITEFPPQTEIRRENLQRDVSVTARLEGTDLGSAVAAVQKAVDALHLALQHSRGVRRHLQAATEIILVTWCWCCSWRSFWCSSFCSLNSDRLPLRWPFWLPRCYQPREYSSR